MILETVELKEYHSNGVLAWVENRAIIAPLAYHLYDNLLTHSDGSKFVRTGMMAKYFDNGQLAWELNHDETGKVLKDNKPSYRKDGTVIIY